jgi:ubiquinone/menaquinone biosynthesis C-methylase UbiE
MAAAYPQKTLLAVAQLCADWDRIYYRPNPSVIEAFLRKEMRLLLQCLFVEMEADPSRPSSQAIGRWLEIAEGLDVHDVRREVLRRVAILSGSATISNYASPTPVPFEYPDSSHLWSWRSYWRKIHDRSRAVFLATRTDDVMCAEERSWPFYQAMGMAEELKAGDPSAPPAAPDVFSESYAEVARRIAQEFRAREKEDPKILEVGCGEGHLLRALRRELTQAKLFATNISGKQGMLAEVLKDSETVVVSASAEKLPFDSATFDAFISTEVIEHLVRPEAMAEEAFRVLKPRGIFLISAPSVHTQFLSRNPLTYLAGLISVFFPRVLPPFHNLYEPLTHLPIVHHAFSHADFTRIFRSVFPNTIVFTMRFTHLRKFRLHGLAGKIPVLKGFGGLIAAQGVKQA